MLEKILAILLALFIGSSLSAVDFGRITGLIENAEGIPISGVNISIENTNHQTQTDENGRFIFEKSPTGNQEILASLIGYNPKTTKIHIEINETKIVNFNLTKDSNRLSGITITATRSEKYLDDLPVKVDVISITEIETTNSQNVDEVISSLNGVNIEQNGYSRGTVKLQGLPSQYTLVLIDGERTKGGHNGTDLSQISLDSVERIEVVKGPSSCLYGSDALGGVVNIITKKAPEKFNLSASYSLNSFYTNVYKFKTGFSKNDWGIVTTARRYDTEGENLWDGYTANNIFTKISYSGINKLFTTGTYYNETRNLYNMEETKGSIKVAGEIRTFDTFLLKGGLYHINYIREMNSGDQTRAEESESKADLQFEKYINDNHFIILGTEYLFKKYDSHIVEGNENIQSVYAQYNLDWNDTFTATIGSRLDYHNDWGKQFAPKLSLMYKKNKIFSLRGSIGKGFKAPSLSQLHSFWFHKPGGGLWIEGNPHLIPENSIGLNCNAEFTIKSYFNNNISFFYNQVKDMITIDEIGVYGEEQLPLYKYFNREKAKTYGAEYAAKYNFLKFFTTGLGYTYLMTEDVQTGNELTNSANHKILGELSYANKDLIKNKLGFSVNFKANWRSKMFLDYYNDSVANQRIIIDANSSLNAFDKFKISFGINNLFNNKYVELSKMPGRTFTTNFEVRY